MTPGILALLIGAFVIPGVLLWLGHRLRRRTPRWRGAFWGGVAGHLIALVVGSIAASTPGSIDGQTRCRAGVLSLLWLLSVSSTV